MPPSAAEPTPTLVGVDDTTPMMLPDPLTVESVADLRAKAGPFKGGTAATADFEQLKGAGRSAHKPKAKRWDHLITKESATRVHSRLKNTARYLSNPGLISLGGGLPSPDYMPFDELSIKVPKLGKWTEAETHADGATITAGKHDMAEGKSPFDIAIAFNYAQGHGSPQLLRFCVEHTEIVHSPKYADWQCTLSIGSTSALDMIFRMLGRAGTPIISEEYTFSTAVECAAAQGMGTVGVPVDDEGMLPDSLDRIMTGWDPAAHSGQPKPCLLYTVPSGQNPTGATQSLARRRALYAVAQKHDMVVIEDEPYYFLQMQPYTGQGRPAPPPPASHAAFLSSLVPSYLSLDTDGRVLRLDSFSKVIAPGARVGWVTGPAQLVERYHRHSDMSTQGPSGISTLALYKLLDEHWGHAGFLDWLVFIRMEYTRRRNVLLGAVERYMPPAPLVSWQPPMAGMFFWIKIDWRRHPRAAELGLEEVEDRLFLRAVDLGSLLIKGSFFKTESGEEKPSDDMYFRATFCAAKESDMDEAVRRFGQAVREEFQLEDAAPAAASSTNGHA